MLQHNAERIGTFGTGLEIYRWTSVVLGQQQCLDSSSTWLTAVLGQQQCLDSSSTWTAAVLGQQQCLDSSSTRSVRKVSDRIFLCEHLMDYNLARLHEPILNLSAHA